MPISASSPQPSAQVLGAFVAGSAWDQLPEAVRREANRLLLNFTGCALGAANDEAIAAAIAAIRPFAGKPSATVIGRRERLDPLAGAFLNAASANLYDFDETHFATAIHPAAPVAAAALALAEHLGAAGADALHALALGVETACRIGLSVSPGHYARGWHITATCGVFGAAAAAAKLLRLSAEETAMALGIAASTSAGLIENLATPAKSVGVGNAARGGIEAALFAKAGATAAPLAIEGTLGWARAMGDTPKTDDITGALGARWEGLRIGYKPYPCGFVFHAEIDACLALGQRLNLKPEDIAGVLVEGNELFLARGERAVAGARDARVSLHHVAAASLARGRAGLDEFIAEAVSDPKIAGLRTKVQARLAPELPIGAVRVSVTMRDGHSETVEVRHAKGSPERPLSDTELQAKFHDNVRASPFEARAAEIIEAIARLDQASDVTALMRILSAG
jgi:2-methylcitrate dehydratase PrpD